MSGQPNSRKLSCLAETLYDMQREWGWVHMSGRVLSSPFFLEKAFDASRQRCSSKSSRLAIENSGLGQIDVWWSECEEATYIDARRLEDLFFRVYDATSRSQYQNPVGSTAEHDRFQDMPHCGWLRFIQPDVNTFDPSAVARHITGRWTGDRHREKMDFGYDLIDLGSDQEEQSKWISTTTSFDWAFYEMARRLARRSKYGHVIDRVSFATIDSKHVAQRLREIRDDSPELQLHLSDRYARAIRFADASSEWLYYGRIFDKSIYKIHHSTREVSSLVVWIRKLHVVAIGDKR